jgi:major membrane immunogen (membrane-anchored lipoprotein)
MAESPGWWTIKKRGRVKIMKKMFTGMFVTLYCLALIAGCGGAAYKDGTYTGKSGVDDTGAWGEAAVTITAGKVSGCRFITYQKDGSEKDADYGKVNGAISNQAFYDKAQLAVRAMEQYAAAFGRTGNLKDVEAVSGATIAWDQFHEAVGEALAAAKK